MGDESEEKTLDPTDHKLKKSREKGQVSSSADFVTAMVTLTGVVVVYVLSSSFLGLFASLFNHGIMVMGDSSKAIMKGQLYFVSEGIITAVAPLAIVVGMVAIVANILHKKGIPFSLHPIKPDFNRLNPAKGLKNLFSKRSFTEFSVALLRVLLWFCSAIFIIWIWLPDLISSPICGAGCILTSIKTIAIYLFLTACILLVVFGILDIPMQVALFKKDQKMSFSEQKRERKTTQGNPEIKGKQRQLGREMLEEAEQGKILEDLQGLLLFGGDCVVEVRFKTGKTPLPIVYAKAKGDIAYDILARARVGGFPVEDIGEVAADIYKKVGRGKTVLQKHFTPVANALVKHKLI